MLKSIYLQMLRIVFLTVTIFFLTVHFNDALAQETSSPQTPAQKVETTSPEKDTEKPTERQNVPEQETNDPSAVSRVSKGFPRHTYDRDAIESYDQEVYGN